MSGTGGFSERSPGEPPRKKIRKGTKSCWECKRRKIKCQLSSEDVPVCSGCLSRGTTCLSQEYPEERDSSSSAQVGERLGRVERLLETLVAKINQYEEEEKVQKDILTPESGANEDLTSYTSNNSVPTQETTPYMSLFDNPLIGHRHSSVSQVPTPHSMNESRTSSCRPPKMDRIRNTLVDLLPSQKDADLIFASSSSWLLVHAMSSHAATVVGEDIAPSGQPTINLLEISKLHPTVIARTILYLAVCLQQLDADFDVNQLRLLPTVDARMERYMMTVQTLVTSDDELVSTMEGLECLILQGIYHINAGNPRRAWLTFRRGLNMAQLMGIHRRDTKILNGRLVYCHIVQADRYLALLLGLPAGSNDDHFSPEETFQNPAMNKDHLFARKLSELSRGIIERNLSETSHAYATTQEIDEKLDEVSKAMPESWWAIPVNILIDRSPEAAEQFDRLMTQIWYNQLEALLHLPFMLRASTERRYEYSRFSCLRASREMIYRYLAIRSTSNASFCCKIVDFGALTATITLLLGLIEPAYASETNEIRQQKEDDRNLVQAILKCVEDLAVADKKNVIASQSANVIRSLLAVDSPSGKTVGNLRLTIPYFGTISIVRPPPTPLDSGNAQYAPKQPTITVDHRLQPEDSTTSNGWPGTTFPQPQDALNVPMVSFTSSHYPLLVPEQSMQDWGLQEADNLFFDSLLNTDIDGNQRSWII